MRRWLERLQRQVDETVARLEKSLRRFSIGAVVLDTWDAFVRDNMSFLAAALSYYALLSLFPLLLLLISFASFFISEASALDTVVRVARAYLPGAEQELQNIMNQVLDVRAPATLIGLVTLLWAASGVFDVLQNAINRAWQVQQARAFWLQRLISIAVVGVLGLLFLVSALTLVFTHDIALGFLGVSTVSREVVRTIGAGLGFASAFLAFAILYKTFPHMRVSWHAALWGALAAAIFWQLAKYLYELYLQYFSRFSLVYGSVGAIIGLLLWGYISATIILLGAELSAQLGKRERQAVEGNEVTVDEVRGS